MTQAVNVLLKCNCIQTIEIETAVSAPKPGEMVECSNHGKKVEIRRVSVPYPVSQDKTSKHKK